jgi:hypothetical protein
MKIFLIATFIILFGSILIPGFCAEYYVDATRDPTDPTNDGTFEKPWATITEAISKVDPNDLDAIVIYVASGIYDVLKGEVFPLEVMSNISLIGADKDTTIIDAKDSISCHIQLVERAGVTIENLTLTGGTGLVGRDG